MSGDFGDKMGYNVKKDVRVNKVLHSGGGDSVDKYNIKEMILQHVEGRAGKRKKEGDVLTCSHIYKAILAAVDESNTTNSDKRKAFVTSVLSVLNTWEDELNANVKIEEEMSNKLIHHLNEIKIIEQRMSKKLVVLKEHFDNFLNRIQKSEIDVTAEQGAAMVKFCKHIEKFKTSLPDVIEKEQAAKKDLLKNVLSLITH